MTQFSLQDNKRTLILLLFPVMLCIGILFLYQLIVQEKSIILFVLIGILFFIICFSSVRLSLILLIFSMLLSPEIGVAQSSGLGVVIRFDDVLLSIMTLSWLARMAIFSDLGIILKNPINKSMIFFSALAITSTVLGAIYGNVNLLVGSFFVLKLIEYFFLFIIVVNYVREEKHIHQLLSSLLVVFGIICIYGIIMVITGGDVSAPFEGEEPERNTLGGYLVLMASVAAGVMLHTPSRVEKICIASVLPLFFIVLLFSISRSGWVSGITALLVLFICTRQKGIMFTLILFALLIIPFSLPEVVQERIHFTFFQQSRLGGQVQFGPIFLDTSTSARIFSYKAVIAHIMRHPFLGYGITGYAFVDGQFFRTLIEMGIIGFASFIWLLVSVHNLIRRGMKKAGSERLHGMTVGFYAGFWALMIHAMSANTFIIVRIAEPFWCIAGLIVAYFFLPAADSNLLNGKQEKTNTEFHEFPGGYR